MTECAPESEITRDVRLTRLGDGGEVPDQWRSVQLDEVARIVTGKTPDTKHRSYWGGDIPFVTPSDIKADPWLRNVERYLSAEGAKFSSVVPTGTVMFTCIASIGKSCITEQVSALNQQINACVPGPEVDAYFLYNALQARVPDMIDLAGTTAVPIINKSTFSKIRLNLPPLDEQRRIAEVLRSVDEAIAANVALVGAGANAAVGALRTMKKAIMFDLLSGRVRVPA
jgi:type I restriction enzyme S subunit